MIYDIDDLIFQLENILNDEVDEASIKDFENITGQMRKYLEKRLNQNDEDY